MKTTSKTLLVILILLTGNNLSKAAPLCVGAGGYVITNSNPQDVWIHWEIVDKICGTMSSGISVFIPANGGTITIPQTAFFGADDIYIVVSDIVALGNTVCPNQSVNGGSSGTCNMGYLNPCQIGGDFASNCILNPWQICWGCGSAVIT